MQPIDEQLVQMCSSEIEDASIKYANGHATDFREVARIIIAALRAQADAKPAGHFFKASRLHPWVQVEADCPNGVPLFTHPAPEAAQALSDEDILAIADRHHTNCNAGLIAFARAILTRASAATVAKPSETDRAVRCLSREPSEKVKAVYTAWAHENGRRAKTLADRIINDYLLHYGFPAQGQSHMQDCIVSVLSAALTEAPQATQPAESSDSRDDDAEFRAWREQQWSAGINPTERDAWMERARRERDLLASVATPAVDYTAQQQAEPVGDVPECDGSHDYAEIRDGARVCSACCPDESNSSEADTLAMAFSAAHHALTEGQIGSREFWNTGIEVGRKLERAAQSGQRALDECELRYDGLLEFAQSNRLDYNELCRVVRAAMAQRANAAEGWKLVPIEPTDAMMEAAQAEWFKGCADPTMHVWDAMLAAAPTPAAQGGDSHG